MKKYMLRNTTQFGFLLIALFGFLAPETLRAAEPPNLIVIMADDLGYADVGFNGCQDIPTPHIDSIAANGVKFTSGYVSYSVCSPSRAGFITGRYQQRFGHERNPQYRPGDPNMGLPTCETTLADTLGNAGYRCGLIGKWHLGAHEVHHPLKRGFHEFFGHLGGGHLYFPEELTIQDGSKVKTEQESYRTWIVRNRKPVKTTKYLTDEFSDEAVRFVERSRGKPFFLFLSYNAPHTPLQATEEYLARFPDINDRKRRTYAAMVSAVDEGVGRLLDTLRQLQLQNNTLVFFLSDNGGPTSKNASDNRPLRGGKSDVWEGGFRVPFVVQWPGTLPQGMVYEKPVISLDIFATIASLVGASTERPLDGVNLMPYLTGKDDGTPHRTIYLRKYDQGKFAVRKDDYKLVIPSKDAKPQLYNLRDDISENKSIASKHPERLNELDKLRKEWASQLIEPKFLGLIHTEAFQKKLKRKKNPK